MARIEGFRVKNYRALRDITLGKLWNTQNAQPITPMTAVIGKNGVGKSTLFDAFGFLADCLKGGVEEACDAVFSGGAKSLSKLEWQAAGKEKGNWAERISPLMDVDNNLSPSFCCFRNKLRRLTR